jgi:hypothetical protein
MMFWMMRNSSGSCIVICWILSSAFYTSFCIPLQVSFLPSVCKPDGVSFQDLLLLL